MGIRTHAVAVDHGDPTAMDGAAALSYVATCRRLSSGNLPGLRKGNLLLLYSNTAASLAGGQVSVWERVGGTTSIVTDTDYRIAAVYDGALTAADRWQMWVNEIAQSMSGSTPGTTLAGSAGSNLQAGMHAGTPTDGYLADLKVWAAALTPEEVIQESRLGRPVRTADLLLWAPYAAAADLKDYSQHGFDGADASATTQQMAQRPYGAPVLLL